MAAKSYGLFREGLKESGKIGIGKLVLRDREDMVALSPHDEGLVLYKLRYPNEVRSMSDVPEVDAAQVSINAEQLKLARNLLDSMTKSIGEIELKDRYGDLLREIIDAKIRGKEVVTVAEEPHPVVDIMKALEAKHRSGKEPKTAYDQSHGKTGCARSKTFKGKKRA